ncbi:MAG TPA: YDG domain-containing protein [Caulobacteraceae bacterium]|nr:YDG domain-containing protein [Caulobacteraceae bacterium]
MARNPISHFFAGAVMLLAGALAGSAHAQSTLPTGGHVVAGSATIGAPAGATLSINQNSNRAVINWNSFSVGQPNAVVFIQPSSSAAVLNRVTGATPSTIAGQIEANGQVYLVNPNGIAITPGGSVQVGGGFVASTLGISTDDFMAGRLSFAGNGASAGVSNAGSIAVGAGGFAALIGGAAANSGVIAAPLGKVALGAAEQATLDLNGDGFMQVAVPTGATTANGQALVSNSGRVDAAGGTVELRAATVATAIRDAVNMSGVVAANSVSGHDGAIVLDGGPGGGVEVSGAIDAAGSGAGESGGAVKITGGSVALAATAKILASGEAGGGTIELGGGPHGADASLADATTTFVADGASIDASATGAGHGGTVSVWSNGTTVFNGAIRATGGPGGGNGGWVETSGEGVLNVGPSAAVSVSAPKGNPGSWLLDPNSNVFIQSTTTNNVCTLAGGTLTCAPSADTSTVAASAITSNVNGLGAGDNVVITTTCGTGNSCSGAQAGNIFVEAAISWATPASLTLNAAGMIQILAPISGTNASSALNLTAGGAIQELGPVATIQVGTLTTGSVGGTDLVALNAVGTFNATNTTSGNISLTNNVPSMLVGVVSQSGGGGVTLTNSGTMILNATIGAGAGTVTLISTGGSLDDAGANDIITAGTLTGSAATGVTLDNPSLVGTLGPFTNTTSGNVDFGNGQSLATSGTISNLAPGGTFTLDIFNGGALTVGGNITTVNGAILLSADSMTLGSAVNAGTARVSLTPFDAGVPIDLGTAPGGVLGLTQASLDQVTAGVLQIGANTAGDLTITAPIGAPAGWSTLSLVNNGTINEQAGDSLTLANLRVSSSGPVTLDVASNNIQTFAASTTSSDSIVDGTGLTIGTVDGVNGISTSGGSAVDVTANGTLSESGGGLVSTTGTLTTSSVGGTTLGAAANAIGTFSATNTTSGNISLTNNVPSMLVGVVSQSGGGGVTLTNSGSMTLNATIGAGAGTVTLISTAGSLDDAGANDIITAGTLTGSAATGVVLDNPSLVGTLGPFTNTTSGNVVIGNGQSLATSGTVSNLAPGGTFQLIVFNGGALTVGGPLTTANGAITLNADAMALNSAVNAGTARVTLSPSSVGVPIDVGTAPGGVLGLTQASLDQVTAGLLQVGANTAGDLTITAPINAPAGWNTLELISNGAISEQAGDSLTLANLAAASVGPVMLNVASNNIQTFAAAGDSTVSVVNGASLTIGTVAGVSGINTSNQIQVATHGSGAITIAGPIASGGGQIDLAAAPGFGVNNTTTSIVSGGGAIVLLGDSIALGGGAGSVNAGSGTLVLAPSTPSDNIVLGAASGAGSLGLQTADVATVTAGQVQIGYRNENGTTAGAFSGNILVLNPVVFATGQTPSVLLVTGASGTVAQVQQLTAGTLGVISGGAVLLSNASNMVATLAGFTDGGAASSFTYVNSGPFIVGALPSSTLGVAVAGGTGLASSAVMAAGAGLPTNPLSGITTTNANITLAGGNLVLSGNIAAGAGTVSLTSTGSISDAGATQIITAGTLTGSSATGVSLGDPNLVGTLGPFTNTTSGNVDVGNGQSLTTSGTISNAAPTGSLTLSIFNGGALTIDGPLTTVNGNITLNADNTMTFNSPVNAGTARVMLTPFTAGVPIDVGTAPGGVLGLTQASLNQVTAGVLQVGGAGSGDLTITAPISAPVGWNTLELISDGAISEQAGDSLTLANLAAASVGPVTLNVASNAIQTFAADSNSTVSVVNGANLTIGTVAGVGGVSGSAVNVTSSGTLSEAGGGLVNTTGTLTTSSVGGTTLGAANTVGAFNATNTTSGNISLANTTGSLMISGVSQSGGGAVTLANSGGLVLTGTIGAGASAVTLAAGGPISEAGGAAVTATSLTGSSVGGATLANGNLVATFGGWTDTGGGSAGLSFHDTEALTVSGVVSSASGPVSLVTSAGNLTLASGTTVTGDGVALATPAAFVNNAGAGAVTASGGGRWLVYSSAPGADTFGGLDSGDTAIWNATYTSLPPASVTPSGDRYLFAEGQTLTVTTTDVSKVYGQDATAAVASAYTIGGFASGVAGAFLSDSAATAFTGTPSVTSPGSAVTASVAGGPYAITAAAGSLASPAGYAVTFANTGALTVNPAPLTASIIGDPTKVYDATTTAALVSGEFALSGFVAGQGATVSPLTGAYNSANVASATTVTAALTAGEFTANAGTSFSNYTLPTTASGAGAITPAPLIATITGDPTRVYDGATTAALAPGEFALSGFVAGQGATLSPPSIGAYNSANVASATTVTAALTAGEFTASPGTLFSNYTLPTTASGAGAITPATLSASIIGDPTKVYDGTTTAALASGEFALLGFVAGQGATVSALTGAYNSANVANATTVTAALTAGDFTANAGVLLSNYTLPTTAAGAGAITPAPLTVTADNASKVYGTGLASAGTEFGVNGLFANDTVTSVSLASNGAAASAQVSGSPYPIIASAAVGTGLSNYTITYLAGVLTVTARPITVAADNLLRLEDEPNPPLTFTVTMGNLVNGDSLSGALATTANIGSPAGVYPITQGTLAATQNYSLSFVDGELVVTSPDLGVSPNKFIPSVLGLALSQLGPAPCLPGDLAAILERTGSVVIFGSQASTSPSGEGGGCISAGGGTSPPVKAAAAQTLRPAAKRPRASRMAAAY